MGLCAHADGGSRDHTRGTHAAPLARSLARSLGCSVEEHLEHVGLGEAAVALRTPAVAELDALVDAAAACGEGRGEAKESD